MPGRSFKEVIEKKKKAIARRPEFGRGTATTRVTVRGGATCDIEDGEWKLIADEGRGDGGDGLGPDPGVYGRAALGSCLAIGYVMWAGYMGVPIDSISVEVEGDYDASGMFGIDDSLPPGWSALRYAVEISSPAPEAKVRELVDYADRHSPLLDSFQRAIPVTGAIKITEAVKG
ncbi:MAG: OsmC family protein [Dehalococcoidia bacterium]